MDRIRTISAALAIMSAALAVMFALIGAPIVALFLVAGAACLAAIVPFPAHEPPARRRVVAACLACTLLALGGLWWAKVDTVPHSHMAILIVHGVGSALLTGWAFKTRSRRRRPTGMRAYYDA